MPSYVVDGAMGYPEAAKFISALRAAGIEANITVGGVSMQPTEAQIELMQVICREFEAEAEPGSMTTLKARIVLEMEWATTPGANREGDLGYEP